MIVTNRRISLTDSFIINNIEIKCIKEFKLLGIIIDNKLNFNAHVSNVSRCINSKLIQTLFNKENFLSKLFSENLVF